MEPITIYHNGECSKCRGALEILQEQGIPHQVRWYIAEPLSKPEIIALLNKLHMQPSDLVRKSESLYKANYEGRNISEDEWITILTKNPILIERPVVEKGKKAVVARPPERIFEILS